MEKLISQLYDLGILLKSKGSNLEIIDPNDALTDDMITQIRNYKNELLTLLDSGLEKVEYRALAKAPEKPFYLTSSAQKRLYFLHAFDKDSLAYNIT